MFFDSLTELIRRYFNKWLWFFVIIFGLCSISIVVMPIYDWINPWEEAVEALEEKNEFSLRWMVGAGGGKSTQNGIVVKEERKRQYVLFPNVFTKPSIFSYSEGIGIENGLVEMEGIAITVLFLYVFVVLFTWFVGRPTIMKFIHNKRNPNKSAHEIAGTRGAIDS